jgi:hypothetical protein
MNESNAKKIGAKRTISCNPCFNCINVGGGSAHATLNLASSSWKSFDIEDRTGALCICLANE